MTRAYFASVVGESYIEEWLGRNHHVTAAALQLLVSLNLGAVTRCSVVGVGE